LHQLIAPGGFVLFHDFNDARNRTDFGIYQAVLENFTDREFIFSGLFGCTAVYRKLPTFREKLRKFFSLSHEF